MALEPVPYYSLGTLTRGDNATLTFSFSKLTADGLTGATLTFLAKWGASDADTAAVVTKTTADFVITQAGDASTPGAATLPLVPADTLSLPNRIVKLAWVVRVLNKTGETHTAARGDLTVEPL